MELDLELPVERHAFTDDITRAFCNSGRCSHGDHLLRLLDLSVDKGGHIRVNIHAPPTLSSCVPDATQHSNK